MQVPIYLRQAFPDYALEVSNDTTTMFAEHRLTIRVVTDKGVETSCRLSHQLITDAEVNQTLQELAIQRISQAVQKVEEQS